MGTAAAIDVLVAILNNAAGISALIQQATAEGRDITPEEWVTITSADDAARARLVAAIASA